MNRDLPTHEAGEARNGRHQLAWLHGLRNMSLEARPQNMREAALQGFSTATERWR
jgi:hypothetical protein